MFKVRAIYGWTFNLALVAAFALFVKGLQPERAHGYDQQGRQQLQSKLAQLDADFGGVPRISVADLPGTLDDNDGRK